MSEPGNSGQRRAADPPGNSSDQTPRESGTIVTFYSYKGGVGRSLALANVAYFLATEPEYERPPVLIIDWDLEAPGLHKFFAEPDAPTDHSHPGLIDYFQRVIELCDAEGPADGLPVERARAPEVVRFCQRLLEQVPLERFVRRLEDVSGISIMRAGTLDETYAEHVRQFEWERFYARHGAFFVHFRERLMETFQYVLIDSRTGLTDTSGICTRLMPEKLVVVFAPNAQNLHGLQEVVRQAVQHRRNSSDVRGLAVFPLASRLDPTVARLRELWWHGGSLETVFGSEHRGTVEGYQPLFERLLREVYELDSCNLETYFADTQIPHDSDYAYGERIAARFERKHAPSMSHSLGNLTHRLVNTTAPWAVVDEAEHLKQVAQAQSRRIEELERAVAGSKKSRWYVPVTATLSAVVAVLLAGGWLNLNTPADILDLAVGPDATVVVMLGLPPRALSTDYERRIYRGAEISPRVVRQALGSVWSPNSRLLGPSGFGYVWRLDDEQGWVETTMLVSEPLAFSADSRRVAYRAVNAFNSALSSVRLADVLDDSVALRLVAKDGSPVNAIGLLGTSPESERVVLGTASGQLLLVTLGKPEPGGLPIELPPNTTTAEVGSHPPSLQTIRVASDGARFVTLSAEAQSSVKVWVAKQTTVSEIAMLPIGEGYAKDVVLNGDGSVAVVAGSREISLWSPGDRAENGRWAKQTLYDERYFGGPGFSDPAISSGDTRPVVAGVKRPGEVTVIDREGRERIVRVYRSVMWSDAMTNDWGVLVFAVLAGLGTGFMLLRRFKSDQSTKVPPGATQTT